MDASVAPRPLDLGGIIATTFRVYRDNYLAFVVILAAYYVPIAALTAAEQAMPDLLAVLGLFVFVATLIGSPLMTGAIIHSTGQALAGGRVDAGTSYGEAWRRLRSLLWGTILAVVAVMLLSITIIGIPVAIYFGVRWSMFSCAIILEGFGGRASLSRSSDLVRGSWWRVFGIGFVMGLIFLGVMILAGITLGIVSAIIGAVGTATGAPLGFALPYSSPLGTLLTILFGAFTLIGLTVLFNDLRLRQQLSGRPVGPTAPPDVPWKGELT
jgi:hypothetical protein